MRKEPIYENCPLSRTLAAVGDAWTLLILRDLFNDKNRFSDIAESLIGISPNILSDRLKHLEEQGIVERNFYSTHPPRAEYKLTGKGKALGPVLSSMLKWGRTY